MVNGLSAECRPRMETITWEISSRQSGLARLQQARSRQNGLAQLTCNRNAKLI